MNGFQLPGVYNVRMPVSVEIEKLPGGTAVVTMQGSVTLGTSLSLADSQIYRTIADGVTKMVIDLTGVDYVDSAGLGMLVYAYGTLNEKQGTLRLFGVAPRVLSLPKMTKTDTFLVVDSSREESLAELGKV
jgi:anti-sigma B factor antagonist